MFICSTTTPKRFKSRVSRSLSASSVTIMETSSRPPVSVEIVRVILERLYGIDTQDLLRVLELNGYDDRNFKIEVKSDTKGFVFKVMNSTDSKSTDLVEGQHALIGHLSSKGFSVPLPVKNKYGKNYSVEEFGEGRSRHIVRLFQYVAGIPMAESAPCDNLFENVGQFTASVTVALQDFSHAALASRSFIWSLGKSPNILKYVDNVVEYPQRRELVKLCVKSFEENVLAEMNGLQKGIIHGDINEHNLLVAHESSTAVDALLDFGDAHEAPLLFEAAVALSYSMIHASSTSPVGPFLRGYERVRSLTVLERSLLNICVCARLSQSLVLGLVAAENDPENEYILSSQKAGWKLLEELSSSNKFP